ncbi:hypothetical protein Hanom_Chr11g00992891 [Helianthus anomalus]
MDQTEFTRMTTLQIEIFRSILGFFMAVGDGTVILHRGHLGLLRDISTYNKQLGQPAA